MIVHVHLQKDQDINVGCSDLDNDKLMEVEREQRRRVDKERDKKDVVHRLEWESVFRTVIIFIMVVL